MILVNHFAPGLSSMVMAEVNDFVYVCTSFEHIGTVSDYEGDSGVSQLRYVSKTSPEPSSAPRHVGCTSTASRSPDPTKRHINTHTVYTQTHLYMAVCSLTETYLLLTTCSEL